MSDENSLIGGSRFKRYFHIQHNKFIFIILVYDTTSLDTLRALNVASMFLKIATFCMHNIYLFCHLQHLLWPMFEFFKHPVFRSFLTVCKHLFCGGQPPY